ncbi:ROK family protein [Kitasatospora sp. NPDC089913]|uniref:ROK family protein n=1 Tax=Kitasatospora sp. NPDC089913 TaxID=3364080 RepID=UPI0037F57831
MTADTADTRPHPRPHPRSRPRPVGAGAVIGIDFGGTKTEVALADSDGTPLRRIRFATRPEQGPDQVLARAGAAVRELAGHARTALGLPVVAHAAVSPGVIRPDRILLTPNLPGWESLALAERLALELGVDSVAVANDVRAGALAELRRGALRGADPGVYLSLGTGVAAALTVGGRVLDGAHQAAGEIAYLDPGRSGGVPVAAVADGRAPLEELVGGKALGERSAAELGEELTADRLFTSADPVAGRIAREALDTLATAVANIAVLLDPERVVVGGGMMAAGAVILPALTEHLDRAVPFPPAVLPARFTADASLHGAITLALDHRRVPAGC